MRIGILTHHSCSNYGANLQLYATARLLQKRGHEVVAFDSHAAPDSGPLRDFVKRYVEISPRCGTDAEFRAATLDLKLDALLVGSDAVLWFQPGAAGGDNAYPNPFWLRWARDLPVRKALIAGSCMGLLYRKLGSRLRNDLKDDLAAFDYLSVRDRWTRSFIDWLGAGPADLVFDPTAALPGLFDPRERPLPVGLARGEYIMLTFSDPDDAAPWVGRMTRAANRRGFKTCFVPHPDRLFWTEAEADCVVEGVMDPLDWLAVLAGAAGYVGERFHPVVLGAMYGVPFEACDYYSRGGLRALLNGRSKTQDFCRRIGASACVTPYGEFFRRRDPERVLDRLGRRPLDEAECGRVFEQAVVAAVEA